MVDPALPPEEYRELVRRNGSRSLARIGLDWEVPGDWSQVEWFGAGPGEACPDSRQAVRVGRFRATVDELQTPYVRPQENGNRADIRWATFTDGAGNGLRFVGEEPSISPRAAGPTDSSTPHGTTAISSRAR